MRTIATYNTPQQIRGIIAKKQVERAVTLIKRAAGREAANGQEFETTAITDLIPNDIVKRQTLIDALNKLPQA